MSKDLPNIKGMPELNFKNYAIAEALDLTDFKTKGIKFMLVVGSNSSGKSLMRRILNELFKKKKREGFAVHYSQQGRSTGGIMRGMMYGDESWEATGILSAKVVKSAFKDRTDGSPYVMLFDEPEIGMSEELQKGTGRFIKQNISKIEGGELYGVFIFTHSRHIVNELKDIASFYDMDKKHTTADEWLNRKVKPLNINTAINGSYDMFRKTSKVIK